MFAVMDRADAAEQVVGLNVESLPRKGGQSKNEVQKSL